MHLLHERPVLDRAAIRRALDPSPLGPSILPPAFQALAASDLADQVEAVTVTPEPMDTEEMSRLWSAIQSHYRPTAAYVVSVVLIETHEAGDVAAAGAVARARSTRPPVASGGVFVEPIASCPAVPDDRPSCRRRRRPPRRLGDTVALRGPPPRRHRRRRLVRAPPARLAQRDHGRDPRPIRPAIDVALPTGAAADQHWPAGV